MRLKHPFEPVVGEDARLLILGTMPSVGSVKGGGYYGNPVNQCWRLLADVLEEPGLAWTSPQLPKEMIEKFDVPDGPNWAWRYEVLRLYKIAMWDVVASCERDGPSSDQDLRNVKVNDFDTFLLAHRTIRTIAFTGRRAEALFRKHAKVPCLKCGQIPFVSPMFGKALGLVCPCGSKEPLTTAAKALADCRPTLPRLVTLPSASPRHAIPYAEKLSRWREEIERALSRVPSTNL